MIGGADDDQHSRPTTPPPSPPIAAAPSPNGGGLGLGRRLLGSIRALSSAIALPSPPPASPKVGLSLLLHLKPPGAADSTPPPSTSLSASGSQEDHADADPSEPQTLAVYRRHGAPAHSSKRALHPLLLQPTVCSDGGGDAPPAAAAVEEHHESGSLVDEAALHTQGADHFYAGDEPSPTESLSIVAEQGKEDKVEVAVSKRDTLLVLGGVAGDDQDKVLQQQCTGVHDQLRSAGDDQDEVVEQQDGTIHPRDNIAVEEQEELEQHATHDMGSAENDQEVEGQGTVGGMGQGRDGAAVDDQEKPLEQCSPCEELGTAESGDADVGQEQVVIDQGATAMDDNAVKDHEVVGQSVMEGMHSTTDDIAVEDQDKGVEQCVTRDLITIENGDAMDDQQVLEQGVVDLTMDDDDSAEEHEVVEEGVVDLTMDDNSVEDHEVLEQSIIDRMHATTDDIAVEKQEKVLERCAVHESRATKDEYTVKEKEMVVEQGVIDKQGATYMDLATKDQDKLSIIDDQGTVPMDDFVVKDHDKAVVQYASDAIITIKGENPVEEHDTVGNQGVIDKNGRTKDDIDVEEHGYVKEQVIIDKWGTSSDATALEDQKNEAEQCISDEWIAGKGMDGVHVEGNMLEQKTDGKQGATQSDFTAEKHKDVVERVCHEWGAPEDDLAMDTTAYQGTREISSSEVVSAIVNGSDGGIVRKEKYKMPVRYPQRPRKLNCPFYMSKGVCTYGPSCHFNHPPLKAKSDDSWRPSEQGNHGVAEILELNRLGLPIREGARNCVYYMRNGACRYGKNCHFNHPDHVIDAQFYQPTGWEDNALQMEKSSDHTLDETSRLKKSSDDATLDDRSHLKKSSDGATVDDTSYSKKSSDHDTSSSSEVLPPNILRMLLPPQKVLPSTEEKAQVKKSSDWPSTSDDSDGCCSADSSDGPLCKQEEHVDYPERPGRPECPFYMRFGDCKFASACKYHHSKGKEQINYPERPGRPECPFYMRFGDCKFASACKYHHSKDKYPARNHPEDPSVGGGLAEYPERPGEPECPFYIKSGFCKFGAQCRFYHPEDSNPTTQSPTNAKRSVGTDEHHPSTRITPEDHVPQQQQYPERPGQPDCRYYMQFGKCKYLSACIFHHPKDRLPVGWNPSDPAHSDQFGPEIHGMPECPFYLKTGKCQFGSACEFRHPKDICSATEEAFGDRTYDNLTRSGNGVEQQEQTMYPERPGEPECYHYMRHGYCKFQMNCKYHHPGDRLSKKPYDSTYH